MATTHMLLLAVSMPSVAQMANLSDAALLASACDQAYGHGTYKASYKTVLICVHETKPMAMVQAKLLMNISITITGTRTRPGPWPWRPHFSALDPLWAACCAGGQSQWW